MRADSPPGSGAKHQKEKQVTGKTRDDRKGAEPPSARQWAEARNRGADNPGEGGSEAGARKGGAIPGGAATHSKADADPGEKPRDEKGLGRA